MDLAKIIDDCNGAGIDWATEIYTEADQDDRAGNRSIDRVKWGTGDVGDAAYVTASEACRANGVKLRDLDDSVRDQLIAAVCAGAQQEWDRLMAVRARQEQTI